MGAGQRVGACRARSPRFRRLAGLVRVGYATRVSSIKDRLVAEGVKLASNPQVAKLMQDPRFMKAAMTALSMPAKLSSLTEEQKEAIVKALGLATVDEVRDLRRTVAALEREVDALRAELARR